MRLATILLALVLASCTGTRPPVEIEAKGGNRSGIDQWRIGLPF